MNLVFQCRLSAAEAKAVEAQPHLLDDIELTVVITLETVRQTCDKPVSGEITDSTGEHVLKAMP